MSLSLSELFERHQSQHSSEPKTEEPQELDENDGTIVFDKSTNRSAIASEKDTEIKPRSVNKAKRKQSKKRRKATPSSSTNSDDDEVGDEEQVTAGTKRIKTESSNGIKNEIDEEKLGSENYWDDNHDENEDDGAVNNTSNRKFYENYSESAKALHNFDKDNSEQRSHSEVLDTIHSTLFPRKNNAALALGNERRLAGDYDDEGQNDSYPSRSLTGRYRPRKRKVTTRVSSGKKDVSYRLETEQEIQDRVQRLEEYNQRYEIRNRWKKRTVNFQAEEDIGDAFLLRAQQSIGDKLREGEKERRRKERRKRKSRRKEREEEEMKEIKELERSDVLEEDDEVKEQSQLLAQLSQPEIVLKENNDSVNPVRNATSTLTPQNLNYWDLGYVMPKRSSISYDFDPSVEKMVQSGSKGTNDSGAKRIEDNHETEDEIKVSFNTLVKNQNSGQQQSSRFFFEPNKSMISSGDSAFRPGYRSGHIHNMLSMAARSLCGGGSGREEDYDLENRYLQMLCLRREGPATWEDSESTVCANFRKRGYLNAFADDQGKNILLFLKHMWDDPVQVAKQLGVLNCFQESAIRGRLLSTIQDHSKKKRSQMSKLHKIRSINWDHDNTYDIESDDDDVDEESVSPSDGKITAETKTNDGVVDAMTVESALTIDKKKNFAPSKDDRDAFISPNTLYSHIAGTRPPIPQCPLDPSAWIFGPVDRYSKFYHISVKMDSSIYNVVLSTLMKRIGQARVASNESVSCTTQQQIMNLIEEFADINENKFYLQYTNMIQDPFDSDIPLVEFYRGVSGYCTFMANGYIESHQSNMFPEGDEMKSSSHDHDYLKEDSKMTLIARKIWEFCRPRIRRNGLMRFPKLRVTFGIALICRSISPSAAEILSRPIDNDGIITPLDLFQQALEDMESNKYITANRNFENNSIRAAELEFLLHDAAEFFQEAVELDPTNVEYQLWHIGCLASCLLISSGNKISNSDVHIYPSQMKGTFINFETVVHELRPCMKKYKEVRIELSTAVRALFTLARYQNSPRAHFAVFSLIEWGQVMGLLVGSQLNEFLHDISERHAFHFGVWAHHEPATYLREYKDITGNICVASLYAQILENDPGEIKNWRNFVLCLGPISDTKNHDWWGKNRCWWRDSLLHIYTPDAFDPELTEPNILSSKKMLRRLKRISTIPYSSSLTGVHGGDDGTSDYQNLDWLPTLEDTKVQNENQVGISKEQRTRCYASDLPKTKKKMSGEEADPASAFLSSISIQSSEHSTLQNLSSLSQEAQAYKIFVSCHLFGLDDPLVCKCIYHTLYCKCVRDEKAETLDENCDEFRVLVWLSSMGIDIADMIKVAGTS